MPLYTLYPCKADGSSDTFVTFDLAGDDEAQVQALLVLDQHITASQVAIWCGEREVAVRYRADEPPVICRNKPVSRDDQP